MKLQEAIEYLYKRHITIVIEWGGNEYASNASDMSKSGSIKLIRALIKSKNKRELEKQIKTIVQNEREYE